MRHYTAERLPAAGTVAVLAGVAVCDGGGGAGVRLDLLLRPGRGKAVQVDIRLTLG